MTNDNDLIRRGDAIKLTGPDPRNEIARAIAALPAVTVGVKPEVVKNAVMAWVWAEDSDVSKCIGLKHTNALITRLLAALEPQPAPDVLSDLAARQHRLPADAEAAIFDNIEDLYEGDDQPVPDAAQAYREGWAFAYRQWEATGSVPQPTEKPHDRA